MGGMREILFRGKRKDNGKWVEGHYGEYYSGKENVSCISISKETISVSLCYDVIPETVGQYTGLTDKNGVKIFEGDICWFYGGDYYSGLWEQNAIVAITDMTDDEQTHYLKNAEYCEVIGNIYDNPELIELDVHKAEAAESE